jgi:hypothetical protein
MAMADDDFLSERGAHELARRIAAYWESEGCRVDLRVEVGKGMPHGGAVVWVVRSDLSLFVPRRSALLDRDRGAD